MNIKWYSDMQKLGSRTGYGMAFCIRLHRSTSEYKMDKRAKKILGAPRPMCEGSRIMISPIIIKRNGKVTGYRVTSV